PQVVGRGRRMLARVDHRPDLGVRVAARAEPGHAAVVRERRPRPDRDERDHRHDGEPDQAGHGTEAPLGLPVGPGLAQPHRAYSGMAIELMIFFAALGCWIHEMNFLAAPLAGPRVTS